MPDLNKLSFSPVTIAKNVIIAAVFFVIAFFALRGTVPSEDPRTITWVAAISATSMAATAWLAWHMFRVVALDHRERRKEREASSPRA